MAQQTVSIGSSHSSENHKNRITTGCSESAIKRPLADPGVRIAMTEIEFEKYQFLRLHSVDMDTASHTLKMLCRYRRMDIKVVLLRDIAVTYSRPFTGNKGVHIKKHFLSPRYVPKHLKTIHQKLLDLRNEQFAHTDLSFHKPKVSKWRTDNGYFYPMSLKTFDYLGLLRQFSSIDDLIKAVDQSLKADIKKYESLFYKSFKATVLRSSP